MFPAVFTTLAETQHCLLELCGSTIFHQAPSPVLPVICELCPTIKALIGTHAVLGPRRQFTLTSLGNATGTVGVEVSVGGAVFVGRGVCVGGGVFVGSATVGDADGCSVGVSVAGILDGKLQASIDRTSISTGNRVRGFIVSPLIWRYLTQSTCL
jgi:hypothetical protein